MSALPAMTTYACPIDGCNVFPYDAAADLASHIVSAHVAPTTAPAPQLRNVAPNPAPHTPPAPGMVRSLNLTTAATVQPRSTAAPTTGNPPSEKQLAFLRKLTAERNLTFEMPADKRAASAEIDRLLKLDVPVGAAKAKPIEDRPEAPEGMHVHDGKVYRVRTSKSSGMRYAEWRDDAPDHNPEDRWQYIGRKPEFWNLSHETVITLDNAAQYGHLTHTCACCGRELTNPDSIARGIGPICAAGL